MEHLLENIYIRCSLISAIGWLLNLFKNLNNVRRDAITANLEFSYSKYFYMEKIALVVNALSQLMVMLFIHDIVQATGKTWIATVFIGLCAFFGSEFVTYVFGAARNIYKREIDEKTTIADTHTGTTETPTPIKTK